MSAKLLPAVLLAMALGAPAAQIDTTVLTVTIRPAVSMTADGATLGIKIRLAPESTAKLWRAEDCGSMPLNAYSISRSGVFSVPIESIEGRGGRICMVSSDGALAHSVLVPSGVL